MIYDAVVKYIRSWFPEAEPLSSDTRKRKNSGSLFPYHSCRKFRKIDVSDTEFFTPLSTMNRSRNSTMQPIVLDDDGDRKSTPRRNQENDDVSFVNSVKSARERFALANAPGVSYITRFNANCEPKRTALPARSSLSRRSIGKRRSSTSLEHSINLNSRRDYEDLLNSVLLQGTPTIYGTPMGFSFNNRSKLMVDLATSPKNRNQPVIDLTDDKDKSKLSTKDRVIKVLDNFEVIDDSDSDVEILPQPPSPKPDIRVEPVNSLRTVVNTSKASKQQWLDNIIKKHESYVDEKTKEIEAYAGNSAALNKINNDIILQSLSRRVQESLAIKDAILPVIELDDDEIETELAELSEEQVRLVKRALGGRDRYEVLTKKFSLNVTRMDLCTLSGLNWLNDNVINFYMNLLIERGEAGKWPKCYAMNTFFYGKLTSAGGAASLRRWTRKVDLFEKELICVPIHLGVHWCMAIIDLKKKTIKYYDSMGKDNDKCLWALKEYLEYEHQDKKGVPFNADDFQMENVKEIPYQMNGSDCGVFACTFAEYATRRARFSFGQENMPYIRQKMVVEILTGELLIQ